MCRPKDFRRLRGRVDRLEDSVHTYHAKTDERIKTLFGSCERLNASCERLSGASSRLMWSLVSLLGIVVVVSVCALVWGACGPDGFNAVTRAAQETCGAAR